MRRELGVDSLVSVVVPIYNEAENLEPFVLEVYHVLKGLSLPGRIEFILCNDGSRDGSAEILDRLAATYPGEVKAVHLARNFGHAAALSASIAHARGDVVIAMDGDMQDDPAAFARFIANWKDGYDVVYAIRTSREENAALRFLFWSFYRLLNWMANFDFPLDAGNFGLMDRSVVDNLRAMNERNLYLPGLRAWVGFRQVGVPVPRRRRYDRKTRVRLRGLWSLAMNAVFAFSNVPLFIFSVAGVAALGVSLGLFAVVSIAKLFTGGAFTPTMSLFISICFFAGVNLLGLAILGGYIARIYDEVKGRPKYIVSRMTEFPQDNVSGQESHD